jgi:PPP family 3-phenylpropionic acid transporter
VLFLASGASGAAFIPFFALLLRDRGFRADEIGLILAVSSLAGVATTPAWSHVADTRMGTVRTLQLTSVATAGIALGLLLTGSSLWATVVVAAALGIVSGPGTALGDVIALGHLGPERMTEYGEVRLWASLGWAIAVVAFGAWFERAGLGPVLPVYAAGTLVYVATTVPFPATRPGRVHERVSRLGSVGEAFRSAPRLLPFLIGLLLVSTATWGAWSFVPLRIAARGGGPFLVGLAACVAALVEIPFFRASGWLGEHVGLRRLYLAGCAVYVMMLTAWSLVAAPTFVALIKMIGGAGYGLTYAALVVITGRLVPERLRNTGQALMQISTVGIGPVAGAAVGGVVYRHLGPPTLFASAAVLASVGALVVWRALSGDEFARGGTLNPPRTSRSVPA